MTADWQVSLVKAAQVDLIWPQVAPLAEKGLKAIRDPDIAAEDIRRLIAEGKFLLWAVHDAEKVIGVLVLNVLQQRRGKVLFIVLVAGHRFTEWAPAVQALLEDYMALIGASRMESHSRRGMEAWMRALGWRPRAVIMEWVPARPTAMEGRNDG